MTANAIPLCQHCLAPRGLGEGVDYCYVQWARTQHDGPMLVRALERCIDTAAARVRALERAQAELRAATREAMRHGDADTIDCAACAGGRGPHSAYCEAIRRLDRALMERERVGR